MFALICFGLVSVVFAAPPYAVTPETKEALVATPETKKEVIAIVNMQNTIDENGSFSYSYEGADGTKSEARGYLKQLPAEKTGEKGEDQEDNAGAAIEGSYEYDGTDGKHYFVKYYADETGFHAEGDHIPRIPDTIARSLEFNKEHPEEEKNV